MLTLLVLDSDDESGRNMSNANGGLGLIDFLTPRTSRPHGIDPEILVLDFDVDFGGFGEDRHGGGTGVDAALRFGFGNALDAMAAALELQVHEGPFPGNRHDDFLEASHFRIPHFHDLHFPPLRFDVTGVHIEEIAGEEGGFLTAGPGADFHDQTSARRGISGCEEILEFGFENVCIATGSRWRADGVARQHVVPVPVSGALPVYTPDDIMEGRLPSGKVVVYDDDHYYMGGVLAELLAQNGCDVTLITTSAYVSDWTLNTLEQGAIHRRLVSAGVKITLNTGLAAIHTGGIETNCSYTDARGQIGCDGLVMVASRVSNDALYHGLVARQADWADAGIRSVKVIGDAGAPGPIAWATYAGHRYARELDMPDIGDALPFRREVTALAED